MDNLLKATVDAISESDNEIGGGLITRLRVNHNHGRDDSSLLAAAATRLTSIDDVFTTDMVGMGIDILEKDTPTGNEGPYVILAFTDTKNVTLQGVDGATPSFVDESDVKWRFSSLQVESTFNFPFSDSRLRAWAGTVPHMITYSQLVQVPSAQEIRGMGEMLYENNGVIDSTLPQTLKTIGEFFSASDVGKGVWILPKSTLTGNEGPRVISAFTSSRQVTVTGTAFSADETEVMIHKQTLSGDGYLTNVDLKKGVEVVDGSGGYNAIERLKRSFFADTATEEELDRVGRNVAVDRPKVFGDLIYRRFLKARAYLPCSTIQAFEIILDAIYPQGGYTIYEDLVNFPNTLFLDLPGQALSTDPEGKAFLAQLEDLTSATTTTITVTDTPISIISVKLQNTVLDLDMALLPSAETPAWTYTNEGEATEGNIFASTSGELIHDQNNGDALGGRYVRAIPEISNEDNEVSVFFQVDTFTADGGRPWHLMIRDGEYEYMWEWDQAGVHALTDQAGAVKAGPETLTALAVETWHHMRITRKGAYIQCYVNGLSVFGKVLASLCATDSNKDISFGYENRSQNQTWIAKWNNLHVVTKSERNYWNIHRSDGAVATSSDDLTSAAALFISGDTDKQVRLYGDDNKNNGVWQATYSSTTVVTLAGIERSFAAVTGKNSDPDGATITLRDPWFRREDVTKEATLLNSGATPTNDGTFDILEFISPYKVKVDNATGFVDEQNLEWKMDPNFTTESTIPWELVDAGSNVTTALTLRDALPEANTPVKVEYTQVLSGQIMANEFVINEGGGGAEPNIFYPFYLYGVDLVIQQLLDDITAAGVVLDFERAY